MSSFIKELSGRFHEHIVREIALWELSPDLTLFLPWAIMISFVCEM